MYLNHAITRAKKRGEGFELGSSGFVLSSIREEDGKDLPNFYLAFVPMIVIFLAFNVVKLDIVIALALGVFLSIVLFLKNLMKDGKLSSILPSLNEGSIGGSTAIISVGSLVGFGIVVSTGPGFKVILDSLASIQGAPLWSFALAVGVLAGVGGSAPGGIGIALPLLAPTYIDQLGVSPEALHRIATIASTTFDTLPSNAGVIWLMAMAGLTHKQAYGPLGVCTVIMTAVATLILLVLLSLFPGLA
ncbi:hypothetical protein OAC89_07260 [Deltaproteobacteria bacterium]|nr:hypothetical protein [Deltaproteobacteria bacterium]